MREATNCDDDDDGIVEDEREEEDEEEEEEEEEVEFDFGEATVFVDKSKTSFSVGLLLPMFSPTLPLPLPEASTRDSELEA